MEFIKEIEIQEKLKGIANTAIINSESITQDDDDLALYSGSADPAIDIEKQHTHEWMSEQIDVLNQQVESLLIENDMLKNGAVSYNQDVLFRFYSELINNYNGRNGEKSPWRDVKILHVVKKLEEIFPNLKPR